MGTELRTDKPGAQPPTRKRRKFAQTMSVSVDAVSGAVNGAAKHVRSMATTEGIIIGGFIGSLLMVLALYTHDQGEHLVTSPIEETLWVAIYLTMVVAFCSFKMPTLWASSNPRKAVFALSFLCGHISLFFDSFAVVLLLTTVTMAAFDGKTRYSHRFNAFAFKTICAFNALTVGGGFYIGELWGLPYFISSGMDNPLAGVPLLLVLTPYCILTSLVAARLFPIKIDPVKFDKEQAFGTIEIATFLVLIIVTHMPFFCIGALLLWSAITGRTVKLVEKVLHELKDGALNAVGLILVALIVLKLPGSAEFAAEHVTGGWVFALAAISSPFAGAMTAGAGGDLALFYENLSWIMLGAPIFVSSSLVAIVVFTDTLDYEDLPAWMQKFASKKKGVMQEALAYTIMVVPMALGLGLLLLVGNMTGLFPWFYTVIAG
jgi:hypothetical protein